jgi:hypothetical protein
LNDAAEVYLQNAEAFRVLFRRQMPVLRYDKGQKYMLLDKK